MYEEPRSGSAMTGNEKLAYEFKLQLEEVFLERGIYESKHFCFVLPSGITVEEHQLDLPFSLKHLKYKLTGQNDLPYPR